MFSWPNSDNGIKLLVSKDSYKMDEDVLEQVEAYIDEFGVPGNR